jgi:hypothetical protein
MTTPSFLKKIPMLVLMAAACLFAFPSLAAVSEIKGLSIEPQIKAIFLSWDKITLQETEAVVVIRKAGSCPQSLYDGEEMYRGNGMNFLDKKVSENTEYCYGVYVYNSLGGSAEMKKSNLVGVISFWKYMGELFQENYFLIGGAIVIVILNLLNTRKRRRYYRNQ